MGRVSDTTGDILQITKYPIDFTNVDTLLFEARLFGFNLDREKITQVWDTKTKWEQEQDYHFHPNDLYYIKHIEEQQIGGTTYRLCFYNNNEIHLLPSDTSAYYYMDLGRWLYCGYQVNQHEAEEKANFFFFEKKPTNEEIDELEEATDKKGLFKPNTIISANVLNKLVQKAKRREERERQKREEQEGKAIDTMEKGDTEKDRYNYSLRYKNNRIKAKLFYISYREGKGGLKYGIEGIPLTKFLSYSYMRENDTRHIKDEMIESLIEEKHLPSNRPVKVWLGKFATTIQRTPCGNRTTEQYIGLPIRSRIQHEGVGRRMSRAKWKHYCERNPYPKIKTKIKIGGVQIHKQYYRHIIRYAIGTRKQNACPSLEALVKKCANLGRYNITQMALLLEGKDLIISYTHKHPQPREHKITIHLDITEEKGVWYLTYGNRRKAFQNFFELEAFKPDTYSPTGDTTKNPNYNAMRYLLDNYFIETQEDFFRIIDQDRQKWIDIDRRAIDLMEKTILRHSDRIKAGSLGHRGGHIVKGKLRNYFVCINSNGNRVDVLT